MKQLAFLVLPVILLSCGEPKVDASSEEEMKSSIENIKSNLTAEEKERFEESLMTIATSNVDFSSVFNSNINSEDYSQNLLSTIKNQINGKTADQIIIQADSIKKVREEKQRLQALKEIQELSEKQETAQQDREELKRFEVLDAKFYKTETFFREEPVIELTVRNSTEHAISRAYFEGTYASPGRQIPWLQDNFNYSISGGIEPGETKTWKLAPNTFGSWGSLEVKDDGILTIEVIRIDGPEEEPLFDSQDLSDYEQERLQQLKEEYSIE